MKYNNKIIKDIDRMGLKPFEVQELDGLDLELYYLNETNHFAENVSKNRFYAWAFEGSTYRLVVERGFYEKTKYFFKADVNQIWVNFLRESAKLQSKAMPISMTVSILPILIAFIGISIPAFRDQSTIIIIAAFAISLIAGMFLTSRLKKNINELSVKAHRALADLLTPAVFEQFFKDQRDYAAEFYQANFADEEDLEEGNEQVLLEAETEDILAEAEDLDLLEEVSEEEIDLNAMTVAELKDLAKEMNLTGYSTLRKAELIELIEKNL